MWIGELWRYPVKSMQGEPLKTAELRSDGIAGDRVVQVRDARGQVVTGRSRPALLGHHATLGPGGEPLVDGRPWMGENVARDIQIAAGEGTRLVRFNDVGRFDVLPLLVATDGAVGKFGYDGRRLRPNIVIGGVADLGERQWEGRILRAGQTIIGIQSLRQRCVMTTFDPDTLMQDIEVLKRIHREFDGRLALNAYVVRGGTLSVGDTVDLVAEPVA